MARDLIYAGMYGGVGVYLLLMLFGLFHRRLMEPVRGPSRLAAGIICAGFLLLGIYHTAQYVRFNSPEGRENLKKMKAAGQNVIIGPGE